MAIVGAKHVSMQLKIKAGVNEDGSVKYQSRSISGINPELTDTEFSDVADALVTLMAEPCHGVHRVVSDEILK